MLSAVIFCIQTDELCGADIKLNDFQSSKQPDYNFKLGEVYFATNLRSGIGWDSNYDQDEEAEASAYYSIGMFTNLSWLPSPRVSFQTDFDVEYVESASASREDQLLVSGGFDQTAASSELEIRIDDRVLTLSSELASSLEGLRVENASGAQEEDDFQQFAYSLGIHYSRALSPTLNARLGYTYASSQSTGGERSDADSSDLDTKTHSVDTQFSLSANQSLRAGLYAGTAVTQRRSEWLSSHHLGFEGSYLSSYAILWDFRLGADYQEEPSRGTDSGAQWAPELQLSARALKRSVWEHSYTLSYRREFANLISEQEDSELAEFSHILALSHELSLDLSADWGLLLRQGLSFVSDVSSRASSKRYNLNLRGRYRLNSQCVLELSYDYLNQFDGGARGYSFSRHIIFTSLSYKL
ncbi:MAG: hypothetical protein CML13_10850 [Puniceicoccaceae bacterium]|nr:hypothetical protein [Puniceicoccaceae bacterium]|tara:strand:- start:61674 stop:62909 length:1236 start_codon:yes stop_codon:yes gene_type:complete